MTTETCKHGHDHSKEPVWIPLQYGRKYHCASAPHASTYEEVSVLPKTKKESRYASLKKWRRGTLRDAVAAGVPQCKLCFGTRRSIV